MELAVARTFEREQNWPAAITNYEAWLEKHPTNESLPQVQYALARANYQAGRETNAFQLFTAFVAQFPTNDLAPLAQWWVADHFYRLARQLCRRGDELRTDLPDAGVENLRPIWIIRRN